MLLIVPGLAVDGLEENVETRELRSPDRRYSREMVPPAPAELLNPANGLEDIVAPVNGRFSISEYLTSFVREVWRWRNQMYAAREKMSTRAKPARQDPTIINTVPSGKEDVSR
jgi:hypothetical protein